MGGLHVLNLYAYRATRPADLWAAPDPVGPQNDCCIRDHLLAVGPQHDWPVVAAWGANAKPSRVAWVTEFHGWIV